MPKKYSHPLDLIHRRLWADDLSEIVRELQRSQLRPVSEADVLDFLFSTQRGDPETQELVRQIRKSLTRAVALNRRILSLRAKHDREIGEALYRDEEDDAILADALAEKQLLTPY